MRAQHDSNSGANAENGQGAVSPSTPIPARRRMLVRGAAAALPTILTLHSGAAAAVARSSNMMGVADGSSADGGVYRCVDELSVKRRGSQLDLGKDPSADVTVIRADVPYSKQEQDGGGPVTGPEMCQTGGTFLNGDGESVIVNKGALVSATAFNSFIGRAVINIREI